MTVNSGHHQFPSIRSILDAVRNTDLTADFLFYFYTVSESKRGNALLHSLLIEQSPARHMPVLAKQKLKLLI